MGPRHAGLLHPRPFATLVRLPLLHRKERQPEQPTRQAAHRRACHEELPQKRHGKVHRRSLQPSGNELRERWLLERDRGHEAHHGAHSPAGENTEEYGDEQRWVLACPEELERAVVCNLAANERFEDDDRRHKRNHVSKGREEQLGRKATAMSAWL